MKKMMILMSMLLVLSACGGTKEKEDNGKPIEVGNDTPIRLTYDRMWEYGAHGESEDSEYIAAVLELIGSLRTGEETDICTEDFTDIVTVYYADGTNERFIFEEYNLVENGKRYRVEGDLSGLRKLLEQCLEGME